ncbi:MAG: hypothetical protein EXS33_03470 [Pedosphaera sp.]|nr:hypothetical protein [Pedosphaera sp.]
MLARLSKWMIVLSLVLATGGHWALLQSVAWARMTVRFSQTARLTVALQKTFDGEHPCQLCQFVAEGKKSEQKQALEKSGAKFDFFNQPGTVALFPPSRFHLLPATAHAATWRADAPPRPPPRAV